MGAIYKKTEKEYKNFKETVDSWYTYQKELVKLSTYADFKDLTRRAAADKKLWDKAFNIAKNPKYDRYQRGPASMVYTFFDKRTPRKMRIFKIKN